MNITHNKINNAISEMENIVLKGQQGAKYNKNRRIRAILRDMEYNQSISPTLKEIWAYFRMWLNPLAKRKLNGHSLT